MHAIPPAGRATTRTHRRRLATLVVALVGLVLGGTLAGCSGDDGGGTGSSAKGSADVVTIADAWVKATDSSMTAAFATLTNTGDAPARLTSVTSEASASVELHETVSDGAGGMSMRPKQGGFTIPAGHDHELAPGGDHIMLMGLRGPLSPGERVVLVLRFDDGSSQTVRALVKDFTGAEEEYAGGTGSSPMADMGGSDGDS